ncbi:MAG: CDP-2,3-bis-(O-geranylgeranyl)-sn-glycerol synthase [DPANN group archaeon]|nr:CDP-2,3-bis-(O-geranylgeranyl)-sn-glycerol synthase [DPANN group archaeon]
MNTLILLIIQAMWFILPAYIANPTPVLLKGTHPIDLGKKFRDGNPILGKGKTWEGLLGGTITGGLIGLIQGQLWHTYSLEIYGLTEMTMGLGIVLGFGALFGDLLGSFIKRRYNVKRGEQFPILDQLDFIIGAYFITSFVIDIKFDWILIWVIVTPAIHKTANYIAYKLKLKDVPW